jgi:hypothetical protein
MKMLNQYAKNPRAASLLAPRMEYEFHWGTL